jgi:hypothetical protein
VTFWLPNSPPNENGCVPTGAGKEGAGVCWVFALAAASCAALRSDSICAFLAAAAPSAAWRASSCWRLFSSASALRCSSTAICCALFSSAIRICSWRFCSASALR